MSAKIDPVEVAQMVIDLPRPSTTLISAQHALALSKVVIAASEFIDACDKDPDDALCYPWKALFIALKGE